MIMAIHDTEEVDEEEEDEDIQAAIREVFGTPPVSTFETTSPSYSYCACVPLTQCNDEIKDDLHIVTQIRFVL